MGKYHRLHRVDNPKGKLGDVIGEDCRGPGRGGTITQNKTVYPMQNKQFYPNHYDPRERKLICKPVQNAENENVYGKMICLLFFPGEAGTKVNVHNALGYQAKNIKPYAKIIHISYSSLSCSVRELVSNLVHAVWKQVFERPVTM